MDLKTLMPKHEAIKTRGTTDVLAISSDDTIQFTKLKPIRQFLVAKTENNDSAWAIDRPRPFYNIDGKQVCMCQLILEDSCVPQRTTYEPDYTNPNIDKIMRDTYHRAKMQVDQNEQQLIAAKYLYVGIAAIIGVLILTYVLA